MLSLKDYILEKALARRDYVNIVLNIAPVILEHILLIHIFNINENVDHWKTEIRGNMKRLTNTKIKSVDSSIKRKDILKKYLLGDPFDNLDNRIIHNEIYALSRDKKMKLDDSVENVWKRIEKDVIIFYERCIEYVAEGDVINLYKYIDEYVNV